MHDISATERHFAMNEVWEAIICFSNDVFKYDSNYFILIFQAKVLSQLDHPNIIAYFDSFEEDGVLMIEMEYADNG